MNNRPGIAATVQMFGRRAATRLHMNEENVTKKILRMAYLLVILLLIMPAAVVLSEQQVLPTDVSRIPAQLTVRTATETKSLITYSKTVIEALDAANITVGEKDLLSLPDNLILEPGSSYDLTLLKRNSVTLSYAGFAVDASAELMSLTDLLSRSGFSLLDTSDGGRIEQLNAGALAEDGTIIAYINADHKTIRILEDIPFSSVTVDDPNLYIGQTKIRTAGVKGQRALIYDDLYENGAFIKRTQTGTEIVKNPVQQVIAKGTKKRIVIAPINRKTVNQTVLRSFDMIRKYLLRNGSFSYNTFKENSNGTISIDGRVYSIKEKGSRTITVYDGLDVCQQKGCHTPARNHNTASGVPAQRGLVATYAYREGDKVVGTALPMGTLVFVEGYGLGVVADIHGSRTDTGMLDVCYDPGEMNGGQVRVGKWTRTVYILNLP